jgi:Dolichyl-phosphate-mannose-protein mannosyltransferase
MSPWQELRRLSLKTRAYLIAVFVLFNVFAVVRALPVNSQLSENREADRGTYNRNVYRVFRLANGQAALPFLEVKNHAIFFDRNPGLFMFVAELFVRGGATTPLPNQLLAILLWNIGLLLLFLWLLKLFDSEPAAAAGLGLLVTTPFVLFYSSSIHHEPWCFCFFNLTFYCFVRYLKEGKPRRLLIATCISYFMLCQNYWFYHMSAGILLVALQLREREFSWRDTLWLAAVPLLASVTTFLQVAYALGGIDAALFRMKDIAAARTLDMRIENSQWFPEKKFVKAYHWRRYPTTVVERIERISGYSVATFCALLFASVVLAGREAWRRLSWMLLALFAGLSWHMAMIQHTVIHRFAGMYGWFLWALIAAVFIDELWRVLVPRHAARVLAALSIPLAFFVLQREYVPFLRAYVTNARAGSVVIEPGKRALEQAKKRTDAANKLSADDMKE